jgi:hypothetical protein
MGNESFHLKLPKKLLIFILACLIGRGSLAQGSLVHLPGDFKDRAYHHVSNLEGFGIRSAGTTGETKTMAYLNNYFSSLNLVTKIDTFDFQSYAANEIHVIEGDNKISFKTIYFNPYQDPDGVSGMGCMLNSDSEFQAARDSIKNHIVFTNGSVPVHRIYRFRPKAIVVLSDSVLQQLNPERKLYAVIANGKLHHLKSYNIYASLNESYKKEIILGAHWDSYNGPGADDNASGVAVVLELARYFNQHKNNFPFNIRFVLFGAEELGLLGSKAWCEKHIKDTASVIYYFNIDCVGDTGAVIADINGGVTYQGKPAVSSQNFAVRDIQALKNPWSYAEDLLSSDDSNVPSWLKNMMTTTLESTHHPFIPARGIGSDHMSFAEKGFVATHIGMDGHNVQHCPQDQISQVNKFSLELAGRIVATVVNKTKERTVHPIPAN